jgi:NodT family efflux transporter outer membrane factor (OMF) lipoprotein
MKELFMNKSMPRLYLLVLPLAALCGCSQLFPKVGPDYQKPELVLPSNWSDATPPNSQQTASDTDRSLAQWWLQLGDAQLDQLIDEALTANLDLRTAKARLQQARAALDQAEAELYPTLKASGSVSQREVSSSSSGTQATGTNIGAGIGSGGVGSTVNGTSYSPGLDASWEIDIFGGIRRGIEAAAADEAATEAKLHSARVSLIAEVARNYVELRSYQRRLAIAKDNLASQSETAQITEWRYQAGLANASDVELAKTSREQTRASIPDLEVGLRSAENRLALLLGRNPGYLREQLAEAKELPVLPTNLATGIPTDVLRQRPDLIAAERTLAAETARVGQKLSKRFPSLTLSGSLSWYTFASAGMSTAIQSIGASLGTTLFDAGRLRAAVDIQSAVQEQALVSYQNSVLTALEEVENALKSYAAGHERVEARRAAAASARNAAQLASQLYQSGLADFQSVLDSERTRLSVEDSLATAEAGLRTSLISLYKALGGGWQESPTAPAQSSSERSSS